MSHAAWRAGAVHMSLPAPGDILCKDFRTSDSTRSHGKQDSIRLVQWNIERGYELPKIIEELKALDADIIALQEVDIACKRSNNVDTGEVIARALSMDYTFLCEFEELHSPVRDARSQGGGVHGNAILSRFDMSSCRAVQHRHHPVDWDNEQVSLAKKEPRRGKRLTLAATVHCPSGPPLLVYSVHLEVFCGMLARIAQFADIMVDAKQQIDKGMYQQAVLGDLNTMAHGRARLSPNYCCDAGIYHQAILGDLNTMAHGIARLSPIYCCDAMRFWSLGRTEARFWHRNVLSVQDPSHAPALDSTDQGQAELSAHNSKLARLGVPADVCADVTNPGFADPFSVVPAETVTLDNPKYRFFGFSLMAGKLDWVLLRRLTVESTAVGNHDYSASDHKWLCADVTPE